jgi:hypothetical protein
MMQLPQVLLAAACVLLGILPAFVFQFLQQAADASRQAYGAALANTAPVVGGPLTGVQELQGIAVFAPIVIAAVLGSLFLVAYIISKLGGARRRVAVPWLCGYVREADCHRYTAHNFYGEIKRYFRWMGGTGRAHHGDQSSVKEQ